MDTNFDLTPSKKGPSLRVCYLCGRSFGLTSYPFHITTCKELFVRREKGEKELPDDPNPSNAEELCTLEEINANALDFYNAMVCSKCDHCFRTFFREQLVKHNKYCTAANPFKRLSAGMSECVHLLHCNSPHFALIYFTSHRFTSLHFTSLLYVHVDDPCPLLKRPHAHPDAPQLTGTTYHISVGGKTYLSVYVCVVGLGE